MKNIKIKIEVSDVVYDLLKVLAEGGQKVEDVLSILVDHVQQGVYRPGSWERDWLLQIFPDFPDKLEPGDPYGRCLPEGNYQPFTRPRRTS